MGKSRNYGNSVLYPEEREGRIKDANKKLRSQIRQLKKTVKQQDAEIRTLQRAYNKTIEYIEETHSGKSVEEVIEIVNGTKHKETKKGQEKVDEQKKLNVEKCPDCGKIEGKEFSVMKFKNFTLKTCSCGYRKRFDTSEGIEGS